MLCRLLHVNAENEWDHESQWLKKRNEIDASVDDSVRKIISAVRDEGDPALLAYTKKFDCPDFSQPFRVSAGDIARAAALLPVEYRECISIAAANIRSFHEAQSEKSWFTTRDDGSILGQMVRPVDAVGLYVPGGKGGDTPLVSSLLMNAIPAQVAGVERIAICTPPRADGTISPTVLAAAHLLDIEEVYRVGGAWSIAAMAYGTESIKKVDVIAGPGNIYVSTAKRILQGLVGIDMVAGPSEVLVLADSSASPAWIAADMLSQAEHDELASAICITTDMTVANSIMKHLDEQCADLPRSQIAKKSLNDWGAVIVASSMKLAVSIANKIAPEHMEICTRDPWSLVPAIRHAGAVFLGQYSPEAVGDYYAGPNHVLPTMGTARFSSALSVQTFCKKTSLISASPEFLRRNHQPIATLARLESLEGHARSVEIRHSRYFQ